MTMPEANLRTPVTVLLAAWISTVTILIPGPWIAGPWPSWVAKALLVFSGVFVCAMGLRRNGGWLLYVKVLSAIFLIYWLSEYMFAIRPVSESVASVLHAIRDLDGLPRAVLIQTQVLLPIVHIACVAWLTLAQRRASRSV